MLIRSQDRLGAGDIDVIEGFLRQARTWALVDPLGGDLVGPLSERDFGLGPVLERWARDDDFWIRRSALLAHERPSASPADTIDRRTTAREISL